MIPANTISNRHIRVLGCFNGNGYTPPNITRIRSSCTHETIFLRNNDAAIENDFQTVGFIIKGNTGNISGIHRRQWFAFGLTADSAGLGRSQSRVNPCVSNSGTSVVGYIALKSGGILSAFKESHVRNIKNFPVAGSYGNTKPFKSFTD